jgi:hypothetical protein
MNQTVLVACPTWQGKLYCLQAYLNAYKAFTYPSKELLFVDNTPNGLDYKRILSEHAPCLRSTPMQHVQDAVELAWVKILEYAHENGIDWILSIEQDVICPPNTIDIMIEHATVKQPFVMHSYPCRGPGPNTGRPIYSLGLCLMPTGVLWKTRNRWMSVFEGWVRYYCGEIICLDHLVDPVHMREDDQTITFDYYQGPEDPNNPNFWFHHAIEQQLNK